MIETREIKAAAIAQKEDLASPKHCLQPTPWAEESKETQGKFHAQLLALHSQTVHWKKSKVQVTANEER